MNDADFQQQLYEARFGRKMTYKTAESLRNGRDFSTQIDNFVVDTENKLLIVIKSALNDLTTDANTSKRKGGRVPIVTGFLWHSAKATVNQKPSGSIRGDKEKTYTYEASEIESVIARLKMGDVFYFGWTAEYARLMEARNGFLESALMKWQSFVDKAISRLK